MDFTGLKEFMAKTGWGYLATTDGELPGVRPMGGCAWVGKEFWCATGDPTAKVDQLRRVPYAEYCFANANGDHVRLFGKCVVSTDLAEKEKLLELRPGLRNYVKDASDPHYVVIKMTPELVRFMEMTEMAYKEVSLD